MAGIIAKICGMSFTSSAWVDDFFMQPADHLLRHYTRSRRQQTDGFTDELFLRLGVLRALEGDESGRAFLQTLADQPKVQTLARSTWFDAFQSSRRLSVIAEVAEMSVITILSANSRHVIGSVPLRNSRTFQCGQSMATRPNTPAMPPRTPKARTCLPG